MNRQEHLDWCKQRANEYIELGDLQQAFASFVSDMNKHSETQDHIALELGSMLLISENLSSPHQMREWIDGFN